MERNIKIDAITLKKISLGENNVGVTLLTSQDEQLFVMAFGAKKSKSRLYSGVNQFTYGVWDLYHDPVKDMWRGKEFSVIDSNSEIQLNLERFYSASLFLEIILKSNGSQGVFSLLRDSLHFIQTERDYNRVLIQFLLRILHDQGTLPQFSLCSECGKIVVNEPLFFSYGEELLCKSCNNGRLNSFLNPGILKYCEKTMGLDIQSGLKIGMDRDSSETLKKYLIELIKIYTGGKLLTLNSANGLI